jgi:hypothetical protein
MAIINASREPDFRCGAHFLLKSSKKTLLDGRGCIFSRSRMVQVVAFWLFFGVGIDPGAVRLR